MKNQFYSVISVLFAILIPVFLTESTLAQDATKVDSTHYKVEFENDQVRVLRISYGPGEKSVMHEHREGVEVFLTDHRVKFTYPGRKDRGGHRKGRTDQMGSCSETPAGKYR